MRGGALRWGPGPALATIVVVCGVVAGGLYVLTARSGSELERAGRANALTLADMEARLGLGWTHDLAASGLGAGLLGTLWVATYALGYWPFLGLAAAWTLVFDRSRLGHFLAVIGVTGLVGVTVMAIFPVSPPRLVGAADAIAGSSLEAIAHPDRLMNEHGAMPSFHVAWSVAAAVTLAAADGPWRALRRASWLQPVLMAVATVATGNHWITDALAGLALIAVAWRPVATMVAVVRRHLAADRCHSPAPMAFDRERDGVGARGLRIVRGGAQQWGRDQARDDAEESGTSR